MHKRWLASLPYRSCSEIRSCEWSSIIITRSSSKCPFLDELDTRLGPSFGITKATHYRGRSFCFTRRQEAHRVWVWARLESVLRDRLTVCFHCQPRIFILLKFLLIKTTSSMTPHSSDSNKNLMSGDVDNAARTPLCEVAQTAFLVCHRCIDFEYPITTLPFQVSEAFSRQSRNAFVLAAA